MTFPHLFIFQKKFQKLQIITFRRFLFPDNTLYFWKYPEDEQKRKLPIESETISLHDCTSETITLAPRDVCSRMNTFLLENRRRIQSGDRDALNVAVVRIFACVSLGVF